MPQHSCFYRQKISLPLFGMWGAWGCPLSHRHCLCSNSAARAMTFLIAERLGSGGMHLCLHKVHIVEKILLSQSTFWTSSTMRGFPLHMFKTFVVERENDGAREEGVSSGVAALSRMICYFLFLFYFLLIYPFIITNFNLEDPFGAGLCWNVTHANLERNIKWQYTKNDRAHVGTKSLWLKKKPA